MANSMAKTCWLYQLLQELHNPLLRATPIYGGNVGAVYLPNLIQHQRTKHIQIDLHFVHERIVVRDVCISTTSQFVDIFTKGLLSSVFSEFQSSLNIWCR
jgi:hypothetical protein